MRCYSIDEASARLAHDMMSMSDYKEGSKTAEYRRMVDAAAELADGTYRILIWTPSADKSQDTFRLGGNFLKMGYRVEDLSPLTQADEHFIPIEKIIGKEVEEVQK